nr:hypothetical protein Iba_chr03eCG6420 [Ipomoea batatas]GME19095.1 hypothetical protein Iba_scaffold22050CG0260 [Ipomoea batatas]
MQKLKSTNIICGKRKLQVEGEAFPVSPVPLQNRVEEFFNSPSFAPVPAVRDFICGSLGERLTEILNNR